MKTAAALVLLWVTPQAWSPNAAVAQQAPARTAPASTQTEAPAKAQEQASKTAVKINPEKEAAIRLLFEIQGTKKSMEQVFAGMREDIEGLAQFYQTPLGKKVNSVLPQLTVEIQTTAMNMGQELGRQAMIEVLAEHPELQKALQDASVQKN